MTKARLTERPLSTHTVFSGRLLTVRKDEVALPDGGVATREFIVHPGAVVVIPSLSDGRLVLIRQFRYPLGRVFLELPAGKRDPGESTLQTGRRELLEETGYAAGRWHYLTQIHPGIGYTTEEMALYLAEDLTQRGASQDEDEFIEVVEMPLEEALDQVRAGAITDVKTVIGLFWAEKLRRGEWPIPAAP